MTDLIVKTFIKDYKNVTDSKVRMKYGILSGCVGIAVNVILCLLKFFVGSLTGSIAITADAVNNLPTQGRPPLRFSVSKWQASPPTGIIRSVTAESNT